MLRGKRVVMCHCSPLTKLGKIHVPEVDDFLSFDGRLSLFPVSAQEGLLSRAEQKSIIPMYWVVNTSSQGIGSAIV